MGVPHTGQLAGISIQPLVPGPLLDDRPDDLGDHVTGLVQDHVVADAHVAPAHLVEVVERRPRDGRTGHLDRRQMRHGSERPGAPDVGHDVLDERLDLLGRVLVGDRPARRVRNHPQPSLELERIDLDDHAVRAVRELVARLLPALDEADHTIDVEVRAAVRLDREAERLQPIQGRCLSLHAALLDEHVEPCGEAPAGGYRRVNLAQRTGAAVTWVGIQRQPGLLALGVDARELGLGHVHLAAHLDADRFVQALGHVLDGAQVRRHVLAGRAVAASRALREGAVDIAQADRQAVDLQLGVIAQGGRLVSAVPLPQQAPHAGIEGAQLVDAEDVVERQHGRCVAHLLEQSARGRAADPLRGRVRRAYFGMRFLELHQLAKQRVVLGVADLRRVLDVIQPVGALDLRAQLGSAGGKVRCHEPNDRRLAVQPSSSRLASEASSFFTPRSGKATVTSSSSRVNLDVTTVPSPKAWWRTWSPSR